MTVTRSTFSHTPLGYAEPMGNSDCRYSVLAWHIHGSWIGPFVSGQHRYLLPVAGCGGPDGRGLCGRDWPHAKEIPTEDLRDAHFDVVVLQRPEEIELTDRWTGRRPGIDAPAVYVEHNAPRPSAATSVHPLAARDDILIVHVTDFNQLMWDNGCAPTTVIDHGMADPGELYVGDIPAAAAMMNEPIRRRRVVGADLLGEFAETVPIDVWGIGTKELNDPRHRRSGVTGMGDVPTARLLPDVAMRRVCLDTARWTSLGMSHDAGVVSADVTTLRRALEEFLADTAAAQIAGKPARSYALAHFGIDRFHAEWDRVIESVCA